MGLDIHALEVVTAGKDEDLAHAAKVSKAEIHFSASSLLHQGKKAGLAAQLFYMMTTIKPHTKHTPTENYSR